MYIYKRLRSLTPTFCLLLAFISSSEAEEMKVLKMGLGTGTVESTSTPPGINCGSTCDFDFTATTVTLRATDGPNSIFAGWAGLGISCPGTGDCDVDMTTARNVRATFNPTFVIPELVECRETAAPPDNCTHQNIEDYLIANPEVDTAAEFIAALPSIYLENWILMTRSESLQTGTALYPRILLPSPDARFVFSIGTIVSDSFPGSHPDAVEYMQFDEETNNFRFHEIVLKTIDDMHTVDAKFTFPERIGPQVIEDDPKCTKCHSTKNVPNTSAAYGTAPRTTTRGESIAKNKPNWDAYDSWAGMMPFNRDRIYEDSVEEAAFEHLFNLWNWRGSNQNDSIRQILEQLKLQPTSLPTTSNHAITANRDEITNDGHIEFGYEKDGVPDAPAAGLVDNTTSYEFNNSPGSILSADMTTVNQEGRYVTLRHSTRSASSATNESYLAPGSDEGRGVRFFDLLGGFGNSGVNLNALRIADELINHRYATSDLPIDVRPVALAILSGYITINASDEISPTISTDHDFFLSRNGLTFPGYDSIADLLADTRSRAQSLPRRKADIQKHNLDHYTVDGSDTGSADDPDHYLATSDLTTDLANGLIQQFDPSLGSAIERRREDIFRRSKDLGIADQTDVGGVMVDRENYDVGQDNSKAVTLLRYFLEPLEISVDKWSMGVRGRSRAYNFADVFSRYKTTVIGLLEADLEGDRPPSGFSAPDGPNPFTATEANVMTAVDESLANSRLPDVVNPFDPAYDPTSDPNVPTFIAIQRIFNKSCIECHGGLNYPPYFNHGYGLDFSEQEEVPDPPLLDPLWNRLDTPFEAAISYTSLFINENDADEVVKDFDDDDDGILDSGGGYLYEKIARLANEDCPHNASGVTYGLMPCGGPSLSKADINTIERWIFGGQPHTAGDPHIRTIQGIDYDFQAAGEFVLLKGPGVEVQARQTAIQGTAPYGPNPYTGLTSCVSVNSAAAIRVGRDRITYQAGFKGNFEQGELELRIDGKVWPLGSEAIPLPSGGRITRTTAADGIQIDAPGGTKVVLTPHFWSSQQIWYMTIDLYRARGTMGLMGNIAPGNWLPALPDGTLLGSKPKTLPERYEDLYNKFGNAWRVSDTSTLFDYAPGQSTDNFSFPTWPNGESPQSCFLPPQNPNVNPSPPVIVPMTVAEAETHCAAVEDSVLKDNCIGDVSITGEISFAQTYLRSQDIRNNKLPRTPNLIYPPDNETLPVGLVDFRWDESNDVDDDDVTYRHCIWNVNKLPNANECDSITPTTTSTDSPVDPKFQYWLILVIFLLFVILIIILLRKKHSVLTLIAIALLIALVVILMYSIKPTDQAPLTYTAEDLQSGEIYYWKVIADDGKGGIVESKTRRLRIE